MKARPRRAFVVTVSMLGSMAALGCGKTASSSSSGSSECKPPDCHMNPPPLPPTGQPLPPKTVQISMNPPAVRDAGSMPKPLATPSASSAK